MNIKKILILAVFSVLFATSIGLFARRYYRRGPGGRPGIGFSLNIGTGPRRPYGWYRHPRRYDWPLNIGLLAYSGPSYSYRNWDGDRIAIRNYRDLQNEMEIIQSKIKRVEHDLQEAVSRREKANLEDELYRLERAQDRLYEVKKRLDRYMR